MATKTSRLYFDDRSEKYYLKVYAPEYDKYRKTERALQIQCSHADTDARRELFLAKMEKIHNNKLMCVSYEEVRREDFPNAKINALGKNAKLALDKTLNGRR